jgi:hypothetical protein
MESLCRVNVFKYCLRHKEREDTLLEFNQRLDNVIKSFMFSSQEQGSLIKRLKLIYIVKVEILVGTHLQALSDKSDNVEQRLEVGGSEALS